MDEEVRYVCSSLTQSIAVVQQRSDALRKLLQGNGSSEWLASLRKAIGSVEEGKGGRKGRGMDCLLLLLVFFFFVFRTF